MSNKRRMALEKIGLFCAVHKWLVIALVLLVTGVMGVFASKLEINLGVLSLVDDKDPEVQLVNYVNSNFGGMDYTFIALSADTVYDAKKYADALADELTKSPMILRVIHKIDTDSLMKYGLLFLDEKQIGDFEKYVMDNQQDLISIFKDVNTVPFLTAFNQSLERQIIEQDEIGDPDDALESLEDFGNFIDTMDSYLEQGEKLGPYKLKKSLRALFLPKDDNKSDTLEDDYVLSKDGKTVLLFVMPSETGDDMVYTTKLMGFLEPLAEKVGKQFPGAKYSIAGNVAIMRDEHQAILHDTKLSTIITFVLVLIIFFVFFRKFSDLGLIGICLAVGVVWTYGITYFYIGFLGVTTAFFSAILLGLGVDFAIHIIARYGEELKEASTVEEAIAKAVGGSGPGILTGSLTTSAAFLVLMIARFKGISQLGFVAGTGILAMVVIMFTLLPAMIAVRDRSKSAQSAIRTRSERFSLAPLAAFMVRHRVPALIAVGIMTLVMGIAATQIQFNYDFRSLEPRNGKAVEAGHKLEKEFGKSMDYSLVIADSVDQCREFTKALETRPTVSDINSISDYIPTNQEEKAPKIRAIAPLLDPVKVETGVGDAVVDAEGINALSHTIKESRRMVLAIKQLAILGGHFGVEDKCTEVMKKADALAIKIKDTNEKFTDGATYFQKTLGDELTGLIGNIKEASLAKPLGIQELPQMVRENFIGLDGKFVVYAYPSEYLWNKDMLQRTWDDLRSITPKSTSVGLIFLEIINKIKIDFRSAVWLSLVMVFLLVFIDFRRLTTALMALVPLLLGGLWMIGTMVLVGLKFNVINVAVVPLIIGIGIDNGVHIIHRYRSESKDKIRMAVQHTGRAIFLSSITTMAGFGSLGLATYVAVATLGWVLVFGVFYCLATSVIVLPILLSLVEDKLGKI